MIIKYANKRMEKYFSDYSEMKKKIPAEWVRNIKKHIDRMKAAETFFRWGWDIQNCSKGERQGNILFMLRGM